MAQSENITNYHSVCAYDISPEAINWPTINCLPAMIGIIDWVIPYVGILVPVCGNVRVWYNRVGLDELVKIRRVIPRPQIDQSAGIGELTCKAIIG